MTIKSPAAKVIETNVRNFVHLEKPGPAYEIVSYALDKKQKYLVTVEILADMPRDNSEICLAYLKVWNFEKANLLQIISLNAESTDKFCVAFIDPDCFILTVKSEAKAFRLIQGKWVVVREFDYQKDSTDKQIV